MAKELIIKIGGALDPSLQNAISAAERQLGSLGRNVNTAVNVAAGAAAAAGAGLIVDSTKKAISYEKAMAGVAKVVDGARDANGNLTETYYDLYDGILDLSTEIPMAANDIASIVEAAGQSGIAENELLSFAESAAKMGIAFDTTAEQAGEWMAQWRTSMSLTQPEVESLADQINYLGNTSSERATKLAEVVSRVGSLGQIAGLSGGEVAALAAAMPGVEAEIAATGIKNMTKAMTLGEAATEKQQAVLEKLGFNATDLAARMQVDAKGAILDLLGAMSQLPEAEQSAALSQYFGNESIAAIAPLLANLDNLRTQFDKVSDSTQYAGSMQKEYEAAADTTANKLTLLNNAFEKEQIKLGQKILPLVGDAAETLAAKMPTLFETFSEGIEKAIPVASDLLGGLIDNSDNIISAAKGIAKAFVGIKLGSGTIKGIDSLISFGKVLAPIARSGGAAGVLKTLIGTFTGATTAAGTFGGIVTGVLSGIAAAALPSVGVAAGIAAVAGAIDYFSNRKYHYADGMLETASQIEEASVGLQKYNDLAQEVSSLRLVIADPNSSTEQVESAKQRLEEIAQMLGEEYNLVINADTSELETAINMAQQLERSELIDSSTDLINKVQGGAEQYKLDTESIPQLEKQQSSLESMQTVYNDLVSGAEMYRTSFEKGLSTQDEYISNMDTLYQKAKAAGIEFQFLDQEHLDSYGVQAFVDAINGGLSMTNLQLSGVNKELDRCTSSTSEFDKSVEQASTYLSQALASDVNAGNAFGADTDIQMLEQLGQAMVLAGKNTDSVATSFAAAKSGYTEFAAAIADGKAAEMANSFIDYKLAIGETAENAVSGAALIQNGFENVAQATAAGGDAINAVISDMKSLGDMQGIFEGISTPDGIADKLSDMAHAMNLIPENKTITIDANGNFAVIEEAENQIASLKSQGNVDVSVNANGDVSIVNEATGEMAALQGMGAVSLSVNAQGNIDVLNKAGEVIATIDSKNAQVSVNGQVYGLSEIEAAMQASGNLKDVSATQTVTGTFTGRAELKEAIQNQIQLKPVNVAQTVKGSFPGKAEIETALSYQSSLQDKSVTYTVNYVQNGTPPANNAAGTNYWRGGLTYVNDQNIPDPREVIEYNGSRWWYEGRDVLADIPRGARIYNAAESRSMIDGSHRDGLDYVPYDGYIAELHRGERVLTSDEAAAYNGISISDMMAWVQDVMDEMRRNGPQRGGSGSDGGTPSIVFSPNITITGSADADTMRQTMRLSFAEFKDYMREYERDKRRKEF